MTNTSKTPDFKLSYSVNKGNCENNDRLRSILKTTHDRNEQIDNVNDSDQTCPAPNNGGHIKSEPLIDIVQESQLAQIETIPSLVLTVFYHGQPVHITLDGGATCNYIKQEVCQKYGFKINPNRQTSVLGDKRTKIESVGEIDEVFSRDTWTVRLRAIVVMTLGADIFGGTVFQNDNDIVPRQKTREITVHGKYRIYSTDMSLPLPQDISPTQRAINASTTVITLNSNKVLLPGNSIAIPIHPSEYCDGDMLVTEPRAENKNKNWPPPQMCAVSDNQIQLENKTSEPIIIGDDIHVIGINKTCQTIEPDTWAAQSPDASQEGQPAHRTVNPSWALQTGVVADEEWGEKYAVQNIQHDNKMKTGFSFSEPCHINLIHINNEKVDKNTRKRLDQIHSKYADVFHPTLQEGYNGAAGAHSVKLHWADSSRPPANKIYAPRWSTNRDDVLQSKMDQLTEDGVLLIPQEVDVQVKFISNVFLQKKGRAAHKNLNECSNDELRFLCDFTQLNSYLHPTPAKISTPQEIWVFIAENPCIIVADMYNSYFQMHMDQRDYPYLGVMTPHKGLRIMARSGQGLLNSDTELKELVAKVLGPEIAQGLCKVIADDLVIGGKTTDEAIENYACVLSKLSNANIKLTPEKTRIFPKQVTLHGWQLKDGLIEPDPHRQLSFAKMNSQDIKTTSHLRSWIGLLKTFLPAMSNNCHLLDCLETAVAGKKPKTDLLWTDEMRQNFEKIKILAKTNIKRLALPATHEQLFLLPDAAVKFPGIGFSLMVKRKDHFLPVLFMGFKLKSYHRLWYPCEQEALGVAVAVEKSAYHITQNKNRTIVGVDSKPVVEAFALLKAGKFSSSSRMQSFLHCLNRFPITVQHISGKFRANIPGDYMSRTPPTCSDPDKCQLCRFVEEKSQAILCSLEHEDKKIVKETPKQYDQVAFSAYEPPTVLNTITLKDLVEGTSDHETPFGNRSAWKKLQQDDASCATAIQHIKTGQPLPKKGSQHNAARTYFANASLSKPDNLLVVRENVPYQSRQRERIVIPKKFVPSIVDQIHHSLSCPSEHQMNKIMDRYFYGINMKRSIQDSKLNCYSCRARQKFPQEITKYNPVSNPQHPGQMFNADVIQRATQDILVARDLFSCLTAATIIQSQKSEHLKDGLISILQPIRHPGPVQVRMDNAPGCQALVKGKDSELETLNIDIQLGDKLNKNAIASVDRAHQELEEEIRKLSPEGKKISSAILAKATQNVNTKLRGQGMSALEIHMAREQTTGENLKLNDKNIAREHMRTKEKNNTYAQRRQEYRNIDQGHQIKVGDLVYLKQDPTMTKHSTRNMYMVTKRGHCKNQVHIQKILHAHGHGLTKLSSESLPVMTDRLFSASFPTEDPKHSKSVKMTPDNVKKIPPSRYDVQQKSLPEWNPIRHYSTDTSDDEIDLCRDVQIDIQPLRGNAINPDPINNIPQRHDNHVVDPENAAHGDTESTDDDDNGLFMRNDPLRDLIRDLKTPHQTPEESDQGEADNETSDHDETEEGDGQAGQSANVNDLNYQLIGTTQKRKAAINARKAMAQQTRVFSRKRNDHIPQTDGACITPITSPNVTPPAPGLTPQATETRPYLKSETVDNFLDTGGGSDRSMDWDNYCETRDDSSDDILNEAYLENLAPSLNFVHGKSTDFNRVYNFDNVLPVQSTPAKTRKTVADRDVFEKVEKNMTKLEPRGFKVKNVFQWAKPKRKDKEDEDHGPPRPPPTQARDK